MKSTKGNYDFAGWVTKNDIKCSDGITIKHNAFADNDGQVVPLVWQHDHGDVTNVIGKITLENHDAGVYGYGVFNETENGQTAKQLVKHGDISSLSIFAKKLKQVGKDLVHGSIKEVSLVLAGANPGALIDYINITHSGDEDVEDGEGFVYTGLLIHSADSLPPEEESEVKHSMTSTEETPRTVEEVFNDMNPEQQAAVATLIEGVLAEQETTVQQSENTEGDDYVKHNVFQASDNQDNQTFLSHADRTAIIANAIADKSSSLKDSMKAALGDDYVKHGVTGIELLFPEAKLAPGQPYSMMPQGTSASRAVEKAHKSPFSKVKTMIMDLTEDSARALGYIKGNQKLEQVFSILTRETTPQTIYKKQKLDRDDIIDIVDFDIVGFINMEMRHMLIEELGRAILVGDWRPDSDPSKIKTANIRPVATDDPMYTIQGGAVTIDKLVETVLKAKINFRGTGQPDLWIHPSLLVDIKLQKGTDGRYLQGHILTDAEVAAMFGCKEVIETTLLPAGQMLMVNLADYTIGASKGGEVTTFDDFDIDFNQYKYLIETRVSGALTIPHSAMIFAVTAPAGE